MGGEILDLRMIKSEIGVLQITKSRRDDIIIGYFVKRGRTLKG